MRPFVAVALALGACGGSLALPAAVSADAGAPAAGGIEGGDGGVQPAGPSLAGCPMFPASDPWNQDVSRAPLDPHSADYLAFMGAASSHLQPDFGGEYGQPYAVVPAGQPRVAMSFLYAAQSDPGPYPFPPDVPIQGDPDRHATVLAQGECRLYETYDTYASSSGFRADSGAVFDLRTGAPRPDGWTSATASGLPILPGLARYDEAVEQGEIRHALAFTAGGTAHAYVAPATHSSGTSNAPYAPPMGLRLRLRADFDLSPFEGASLAVLRALQKYGMFLTDNSGGQFWAIDGTKDPRWSVADLDQLKSVPASAFEVVQPGALHSGQ